MSKRLGWTDLSINADGEKLSLEVEIVGRLENRWLDGERELFIDAVYLIGADVKVNILPALKPEHVRALADDVRPQAMLREEAA